MKSLEIRVISKSRTQFFVVSDPSVVPNPIFSRPHTKEKNSRLATRD